MIDIPLVLIDEDTLTYYCAGCHMHTQNINHDCKTAAEEIYQKAREAYEAWEQEQLLYPPQS
jgi:hypothetical protein